MSSSRPPFFRLLSVVFLLSGSLCAAQTPQTNEINRKVEINEITSAYLFKFFEYLTWPDDNQETYTIGFIGADEDLVDVSLRATPSIRVRNKGFTVRNISSIGSIDGTSIHLLYIGERYADKISEISRKVRRTETVLVAFENKNRRDLMINLKKDKDDRLIFEINRSNFVFEDIAVDNQVTLLGGTEMDVAELLREQEDGLYQAKNDLEQTTALLEEAERSFKLKQQKFSTTLKQQAEKLNQKEKEINKAQEELSELSSSLSNSQQELSQNQTLLESRVRAVKEKESQITTLSQEIATNRQILDAQNLELGEKTTTITKQRRTLVIIVGLASMLFLLLLAIVQIARGRSRAIHRLEAEKERTQSLNQELQSFSYAVSHDLRAPLRAISGFGSALLEDYGEGLDEQAQEYIKFMQQSSEEMSELIDGLLVLSRCSRGELNEIDISISDLAKSVIDELIAGNPEANIKFEVEDNLNAWGDPILIKNVLTNLISNAWKYSAKSDVPHVTVGTGKLKNRRYFYVKDNGVGFDMAHSERLFQPFQRLHKQKDYEGSGIGLATVKKIMERHGGKVWAESEPNKGSTFYFNFGEVA